MIHNTLLFFVTICLYFSGVIVVYKLFGKIGLYVWTAFSAILSNIEALVMVDMLGLHLTLGNALYGSSFLVTDILSELHGKKAANKSVSIGLFTTIVWVVATQLILQFIPNNLDFIMPSLQHLFGFVPRIALASIGTYAISQRVDVFLYHWIWEKTGNSTRLLWLRNNGSTMISQLLDTIIFTLVAFGGILSISEIWKLCLTTYIVKFIIAFCDTPILYIIRKVGPSNE